MILQALARRYESTINTGSAIPFGWEIRDAVYALDLDENGVLHNLIPLERVDGKRKVRPTYLLPEEPAGRTVAIKPAFLCDNSKYVFGLSAKSDGREKRCFDKAKEFHREILSNANSSTAHGIIRFFENWDLENAAEHPIITSILLDKKTADAFYKGRFVFQVNGRFAQDDPELKLAWEKTRVLADGEQICCLISGEQDALIKLHGKISLPGVSMGSVPLVSINAESFASYGKSKDDPAAQIGEKAAFSYTTALNSLLKDENHHKWLGKDTLVYWAEGGGEQEAFTFSWLGDPKEDDSQKLDAIIEKYRQGLKLNVEKCEMERPFYLLCLSPNAGRISVRFFYQSTFEDVLKNNLNHYRNMEIAMSSNEKFHYLPPWILLSETTVKKQTGDASPILGGQLLHSIVSGNPYPMTLYNAILMRIRAGEKVNRTKAAIIKAVLIKNFNESEVTTVSLNQQSEKKPYVLGRLFSLLERMQQDASGGQLNSSIRDRYFSSACANPSSTFPILLKLSMHHIAKVKNPVYFEKLKGELIAKLDDQLPFPAAFNLEEQGQFIIGYYHQTQYFFTSKKDKEEIKNV